MVILAFPFKIIWAFGVVWGNASSAQKREYQSAFWWSIIIFVAPVMMMWNSCELRPVVKKRNALIKVNCEGAKSFQPMKLRKLTNMDLSKVGLINIQS